MLILGDIEKGLLHPAEQHVGGFLRAEAIVLGIAMADEIYYEMALNPLEHFTISASEGATRAIMHFPRTKFSLE